MRSGGSSSSSSQGKSEELRINWVSASLQITDLNSKVYLYRKGQTVNGSIMIYHSLSPEGDKRPTQGGEEASNAISPGGYVKIEM